MKTHSGTYLKYAIITIIIIGTYSCRKTLNNLLPEQVIDNKAIWAQKYYNNVLQSGQGNQVSYRNISNKISAVSQITSKPNMKVPMWVRAYSDKTRLFEFVEVPLIYTLKISASVGKIGEQPNKQVIKASFDRLVIFKDKTGAINQRIITYTPTVEYLARHNGDVSHNRINHLDKDFDGFLRYKTWDGNHLFTLKIKNGKAIKKFVPGTGKVTQRNGATQSRGKLMQGGDRYGATSNLGEDGGNGCIDWYYQEFSQICYYLNPDDTIPISCDDPVLIYEEYLYSDCPGDEGYEEGQGNFCADPANFNTAICNTPTPPDPCNAARELENNDTYKTLLQNLQSNFLIDNDNFESGYYGTIGNQPFYSEGYGFLEWDNPQLSELSPFSLEYMFHNHYDDAQALSIFSPDDLNAFCQYIANDKVANYSTFTFGLVTASGTTYALVIEDASKFAAFYNTYFNSSAGFNIFGYLYGSMNAGFPPSQSGIGSSNTPTVNEANFLKLLAFTNSGIALLKGSFDLTQWSKLKIDGSGNITINNCNP